MSTVRETNEVIKQTLNKSATYAPNKQDLAEGREWTPRITNELCQVGDEKGYWAYGSGYYGPEGYRGEWLYDITWLDYEGEDLLCVKLAVESQLAPDWKLIYYDLQKLILARADLRCLIFQTRDKQKAKDDIKKLSNQVKLFSQSQVGDNYLFCAWLKEEERFHFCFWQCPPTSYREVLKEAGKTRTGVKR